MWLLAICLPFFSLTTAFGQLQCNPGIYAVASTPGSFSYQFSAYSWPDSNCYNANTVYNWNFGDNGTGTGKTANHTYNAPGYYMVCLTVNHQGTTLTTCDTVMVGISGNCILNFTTNIVGTTVTAVPNFAGGSNCFIPGTVYTWNWGDGIINTVSTTGPQTHTYAVPGSYVVCVKATYNGFLVGQEFCLIVQIGNPNPTVFIAGQVFAGGQCMNQSVKVRLISLDSDEEMTMNTGNGPDSCYYWFSVPAQPIRPWVIRAEPQSFTDYLPTYLGDVIFYTDATIFNTPANPGQTNPLINLVPNLYDSLPWDSLPPGLGIITGNILGAGTVVTSTLGGHTITATFQPQNAQVIITTAGGQPVAVASVNANGTFTIPNLPVGVYSLRVECPKIPSQSVVFELTAANMNRNFIFTTNGSGINSTTANKPLLQSEAMQVFPNPAIDFISLHGAVGTVKIMDAQGRVVMETTQHQNITISQLPSGLYSVKGQNKDGKALTARWIKN